MTKTVLYILAVVLLMNCKEQPQPEKFHFEKLEFHAKGKGCEGFCDTYHLSVDSQRNVKLYSEEVYDRKRYKKMRRIADSMGSKTPNDVYEKLWMKPDLDTIKIGFFKGRVNDTNYIRLLSCLNEWNWDSANVRLSGYDGIDKNITVNYNNKQKTLLFMSVPEKYPKLGLLTHALYNIILQDDFERTRDTFHFESNFFLYPHDIIK